LRRLNHAFAGRADTLHARRHAPYNSSRPALPIRAWILGSRPTITRRSSHQVSSARRVAGSGHRHPSESFRCVPSKLPTKCTAERVAAGRHSTNRSRRRVPRHQCINNGDVLQCHRRKKRYQELRTGRCTETATRFLSRSGRRPSRAGSADTSRGRAPCVFTASWLRLGWLNRLWLLADHLLARSPAPRTLRRLGVVLPDPALTLLARSVSRRRADCELAVPGVLRLRRIPPTSVCGTFQATTSKHRSKRLSQPPPQLRRRGSMSGPRIGYVDVAQ